MAFQDSNPERRNLSITSLAFIVYFFAGGRFEESKVTLNVINANFERPFILAAIAWLALFWFIYRYWLVHSGDFSSNFTREFSAWSNKPCFRKFAERKMGKEFPIDKEEGYHIANVNWKKGRVVLGWVYASNITRDEQQKIVSYSQSRDSENGDLCITGFRGWLIAIRETAKCCLINRSFSEYLVPYLLAALAIIGGILDIFLTSG
ncbi:hypothetical protein [Marinobacter sediminicola]|uniref:hypothetical protein n=1 Tax=Marinobacter sediminicola TaxID=3072994 RepID=UPI002810E498|nr:hypothetical protein [Marinobacter sp. F26243]